MATNRLFDRRVIPPRQRPLSEDHNLMFSLLQDQQRLLALNAYGQRYSTAAETPSNALAYALTGGVELGSFYSRATGGMTVSVDRGWGYSAANITGANNYGGNSGANVNDAAPTPLFLSTEQSLTVPAAPAVGSSRIDIIEVRPNYSLVDVSPVSIWDLILRRFATQNLPKTITWDLDGLTGQVISPAASTAAISYKKGVEAVGTIAAATEPAATAGYIKLARINVVGGTAAITQAMIADLRPLLLPQGRARVAIRALIASNTGGVGTEAFVSVLAPPGVWCRMVDQGHVAGGSHVYSLYVFGIRAPALGAINATLMGTADNYALTLPRLVTACAGTEGKVTIALRATLNSVASIGGAVDVAEGTPYLAFDVFAVAVNNLTASLPASNFPVNLDIDIAQAL